MSDAESVLFMNPTFLSNFIEAYRQYPCLWKVKSQEYRDRNKRDESLEHLLILTKETIPTADIKFLKTRLESLKQSFRREYRKVKDSIRSGAGEDSLYKPKLWYYSALSFIAEHEVHNPSTSNFEGDEEGNEHNANRSQVDTSVSEDVSQEHIPRKRMKTLGTSDERQRLVEKAKEILNKEEDEYDALGKVYAAKLRRMADMQRDLADKLITDVLFKGLMNNITPYTTISDGYNYNSSFNLSAPPSHSMSAPSYSTTPSPNPVLSPNPVRPTNSVMSFSQFSGSYLQEEQNTETDNITYRDM